MMDLILETARQDSRVLAAYLKGSRANGNVPKDVYQDFDIMYVVKEAAPFRKNPAWLDVFGEVILKQEQDDDFGYGERFGIRGDYDKSHWRGNPGNHGAGEEPQPPVCAFVG